ncbi:MAG TPA: pilus assembly protein [Candidatus Brachybacterium merdavium]|uniref:Pilus assembly protein n=1 Tax=Candidatus Brachybacterium merdavium TaxID=2838513 RepID=A0A9D2RQA7_9MICO|nr:pilus assembly protein [Candidatus Brachybacterium merdavium]
MTTTPAAPPHPRGRSGPDRHPHLADPGRGRPCSRLGTALRSDDGAAVAEFPLVAVLIIIIALGVVQAALIMHTRNTLTDAAVQGAHHASLVGSTPQDGAQRAEHLIDERFGRGLGAAATATLDETGTIRVQVTATLPVVGLLGPAAALSVEGRALDEEVW